MLAIAVGLGLLIGLSLGALGGGGSMLAVPALVYLLDQSPHAATTGSLLIVGVTAMAGAVAHWRAGRVRVAQGLVFGVLGIAGSLVGSRLSAAVDPDVLLAAFALLMLGVAAALLRRVGQDAAAAGKAGLPGRQEGAARPVRAVAHSAGAVAVGERPVATASTCTLPAASPRIDTCRAIKIVVAATVVGLLTGFFGVGGGFIVVPALVLALGFEMPVAVGTSLLVIAVNSGAALASRVGSHVHLDWPLLGVFAAAAVAGSFLGQRVASRVEPRRLTVAFTVLLVAVAGYTAVRSVPHLF